MTAKNMLLTFFTIDILATAIAIFNGAGEANKYFQHGGFFTYLSFAQLLFIATIAWDNYIIHKTEEEINLSKPAIAWYLLSLGFVFLALDDLLLLRNHFSKIICEIINHSQICESYDDFAIFFYAFASMLIIFAYRKEFSRYEQAAPLMITGFLMLALMVMLKLVSNIVMGGSFSIESISNERLSDIINILATTSKLITESVFIGVFASCNNLIERLKGLK